jgi:hypothetical protein
MGLGYDFSRLTDAERAELDQLLARDDAGENLTAAEHRRADELSDRARLAPRLPSPPRLPWGSPWNTSNTRGESPPGC